MGRRHQIHFSKLFFLTAVFISFSHASIFTKKAPFFFKSPSSLFPSGQLSEEELEDKKLRSETLSTFQVHWDNRDFQFKHDELVKEIQVADQCQLKLSSFLFEKPQFKTKVIAKVEKNEIVKLQEINNSWALVEKFNDKKTGYMPIDYLESFSEDLGSGFTLTSLFLKEKPDENSKLITTVPQKERVKVVFWDKNKVFIQYKNYQGYVDSELLYLKADFASHALHFKKGWIEIKHREGAFLRTNKNDLVSISEFKAFITNKYRAFSLVNKDKGPKLRSRLEIKNLNGDFWNVSQIPEHGEVWWKKSYQEEAIAASNTILKTEEILKRKIYSMAFYPESKVKGLISAEGVFKTTDGITWKKIEFFKDENWPVAITKNKTWIVGHYKSTNEGESFEPFIRWDYLSKMVEDSYSLAPKFLKLLKLETNDKDQVEFVMDAGFRKIKMRYSVNSSQWNIIK